MTETTAGNLAGGATRIARRPALGRPGAAEIFREAIAGLRRNRSRAVLATLGISWGIVSVVVLLAYGEGFNQALIRGFRGAFGDGVSIMWPGQTSLQAGGERAGRVIRLQARRRRGRRRRAARQGLESGVHGRPARGLAQQRPATWRARWRPTGVIRSQLVAAGRFIDADDVRLQRRVVFLGSDVARKSLDSCSLLAKCAAARLAFDVIGVQKEKVQLSNYGRPDKECVFIPYTTAGQMWNTEYLSVFVYQAMDPTLDGKTTTAVRETLARRLRFNPTDERALRVFGSSQTQEITGGIVLGLKLILSFIGVLTLAIGGVGVMNIMFVSVNERTQEIGLRKALGARRGAIRAFLLGGPVTTAFAARPACCCPGLAAEPAAIPLRTARRPDRHIRHSPAAVSRAVTISAAILIMSASFTPVLPAARWIRSRLLRHE
jgi:putative ABC transport system permease protein